MTNRTVHQQLRLLVLAVVAPILGLSVGLVLWLLAQQRDRVDESLSNTAAALALAVKAELEGWRSTLLVLGSAAELQAGDLAGFHDKARPLAERFNGWVVLYDLAGQQLVNTSVPFGTVIPPAAQRDWLERVANRRQGEISDLFLGTTAKSPIVSMYEPVVIGAEVRYVLALGVRPARLIRLLQEHALPAAWTSAIVDRRQQIVARSAGGDRFIGQPASDWFARRQGQEGLLRGSNLDGYAVLAAFKNIDNSPWTVSVGVREATVASGQRAALLLLIVGGALLVAASIGLGSMVGRTIAHPLVGLAQQAADAESVVTPVTSGIRELDDVSSALVAGRRAEEQARRERERLIAIESASRAKDDFLATLSHELRTPLQAALGWVHILEAKPDAHTVASAAPVIRRNLKQLGGLLDDMVDASRVTSGRMVLQREPIELAAFIEELAAAWRPMIELKQQTLVLNLERGAVVSADRLRLAQVLSNLITNATKFSPDAGVIRVTLVHQGDVAEIEVSDTGAGMDATALQRAFDMYWQGSARGSGQRGLGLGLAVVRQLLQMHGGTVAAHSAGPGQGSVFTVRLPLSRVADLAPRVAGGSSTSLAGLRVLLVDDQPDVLSAVAGMLRSAGAAVTECASGEHALRELGQQAVDVVVTDLAMPELDGFELRRRLLGMPEYADVPVVALSAKVHRGDRAEAEQLQFAAFVAKPVDAGALAEAIRAAVEARRAA